MSFEDFIDEEDIEFVNELENPKKYHYEEHSDDTIHFYEDGEEIDYEEVVDLLNKQEEEIKQLKHKKKQIRKLESELAIYKRKFIECVDKQYDSDDIRRRCEVKEAFEEVFGDDGYD